MSTAKAKGSLAARVVSASFWTQAIRTNYRNPISAGSQTFKSRLHNKGIRWISFKYSKLFNSLDELGYWIKIKWISALTSQNRLRWIRWPVVWKNKFHVFGQVFSHLSYNWLNIETIEFVKWSEEASIARIPCSSEMPFQLISSNERQMKWTNQCANDPDEASAARSRSTCAAGVDWRKKKASISRQNDDEMRASSGQKGLRRPPE